MKENDIREDMNGIKSEILRDDEERKKDQLKRLQAYVEAIQKKVSSHKRLQAKVYPNRQAIVQAVDVCIRRDILKEFLLENKKEVIDMVFFEYDAEAEKRVIYKDGVEEGRAKEIVRSCKDFNLSKEDAIHKLETLLSIPTQSAIDYYEKFSKEFENEFSKAQKIM